jgi:tetratricopeptide (TPR) repeat protein
MENSKDMMKMMDEEFWKRLGPTVRECKAMGLDKDGMCIYIKARDELAEEARKLLADTAAKELKGEEGEKLMKAFRDEAIKAFDMAIEIDQQLAEAFNSQYAKAWNYKGVALQQLGRTADADAAFARAEELGYPG